MAIVYKVGDLIKEANDYDVLVHGCNCFCTMGAGIALQIKKHFPEAYEADLMTHGEEYKLGSVSYTETTPVIVNAYTQYFYNERDINADYDAIRKAMQCIKYKFKGMKIGMPKIGAGLAGGDWDIIESIINEELIDEDVTVILWEKDPQSQSMRSSDIL